MRDQSDPSRSLRHLPFYQRMRLLRLSGTSIKVFVFILLFYACFTQYKVALIKHLLRNTDAFLRTVTPPDTSSKWRKGSRRVKPQRRTPTRYCLKVLFSRLAFPQKMQGRD